MVATIYVLAIVMVVMYVTYPDDFPQLISNPGMLVDAISVEIRRRWMILKLGSLLWIERKKMDYSLWKMKPIIKAEQLKQQEDKTNDRSV
tara:strand:- start:896 stop:1165 length:270 start_codon:yes stop_codon:yes gene_type:complete